MKREGTPKHTEMRYTAKELSSAGRRPPASLEAEQALIGGLLISSGQIDLVSSRLLSTDFYYPAHGRIYGAMQKLRDASKPIDLITVTRALDTSGFLDSVGGFPYIAEMTQNAPSASNIEAYVEIIKENAIFRGLVDVAQELATLGLNPSGRDSESILDLAERKIFDISNSRRREEAGPQGVDVLIPESFELLEQIYRNPNKNGVTGLESGFIDLDQKTYGFQPCELIILAARPAMGKTTLALNFCEHAILKQERPVLVYSLEMPRYQLMARLLSSLSRVDQVKMRTGRLSDEDWSRLSSSHSLLMHRKNLFIDDSSSLNISEMRSKSRRLYREQGGLSLIVIDYLQLMRPSLGIETRALEVAEITRSLKGLSKELSVPIIALSQLNRSLEQRSDKRPLLADLRESGSIEQDADLVLFLYRDEIYSENLDNKGAAEIIIGKHRNGPIGTIKLSFQSKIARFENYATP